MPQPSESVTLYGDKAELFREIQEEMAEEKGFEPGNSETVADLMSHYHQTKR